jgi:isoquinoline 1-oxidoreductase beta subunit
MNTLATMDRRSFLGTTAGGLTLGFALNGFGPIPEAQAAVSTARVNSWLSVGADNSITLTVGASEMGQGSFQGLGQVLAEDLLADPPALRSCRAPTMAVPAPLGTAISLWARGSPATTIGACAMPAPRPQTWRRP